MATMFSLGQRSPVAMENGMAILFEPPVLIMMIGMDQPKIEEIEAVGSGRIVHKFDWNEHTAWLTMQFHLAVGKIYEGDVYFCAGLEKGKFSDDNLAQYADDFSDGFGMACMLVLVDTSDQTIKALRSYGWSNELTHAFLDSCQATRSASKDEADAAARKLMDDHTTAALAEMSKFHFELSGVSDHPMMVTKK